MDRDFTFNRAFSHMQSIEIAKIEMEFLRESLTKTVYVQLVGSARDRTIGIVDWSHMPLIMIPEAEFLAYKRKTTDELKQLGFTGSDERTLKAYKTYADFFRGQYYRFASFKLRMDDGKIISPKKFDIGSNTETFTWLHNYSGPTVSRFEKTDRANEPKPICKDRFGSEIKVGDFIATTKGNELITGTVFRITDTGISAYVRSLNGKSTEMCAMGSNAVIINDETRTKAMLLKLSS